eukprot:1373431-Rhodomonas_salina.8
MAGIEAMRHTTATFKPAASRYISQGPRVIGTGGAAHGWLWYRRAVSVPGILYHALRPTADVPESFEGFERSSIAKDADKRHDDDKKV